MTTLRTIGYEGVTLADFIRTLSVNRVSILIDVRELPLSRRQGFSKTALAAALHNHGIQYLHLRGLGDPKPGREAARRGDYRVFRKIYIQHLKTDAALRDLGTATIYAKAGGACLMCYEREPNECHRLLVADALSATIRLSIRHLGINADGHADSAERRAGPRSGTGKGSASRRHAARRNRLLRGANNKRRMAPSISNSFSAAD